MSDPEKAGNEPIEAPELVPDEANSDSDVQALDSGEEGVTARKAFGTNMSYGRRNGRITYEFNGQWDTWQNLCAAGRGFLYQDEWNHFRTDLVCRNFPSAPAVVRFEKR